jgi:hypothetical protein
MRVRIEEHEDHNGRHVEEIICRDCQEELVERKGELVARKPVKPAARPARREVA